MYRIFTVSIAFLLSTCVLSAQKKTNAILINELQVINDSLLYILNSKVIPSISQPEEDIYIYCIKDSWGEYYVHISLTFLNEWYKADWKDTEGYTFLGEHVIIFKNCRYPKLTKRKLHSTPLKILPYDDDLVPCQYDPPTWTYRYNKHKNQWLLIEEILSW